MRKLSAHYIYPISSAPLKNGILYVDDDGSILDIIDTGGNLKEQASLEFHDGIIVPGFVNAHCHLELSWMKNRIPPHQGIAAFIDKLRKERVHVSNTSVQQSIVDAHNEMKKNGIVAIADIVNTPDTFAYKKNTPDTHSISFAEVFGLDEDMAQQRFDTAVSLVSMAKDHALTAYPTLHSLYSVSEKLARMMVSYAQKNHTPLSIHFMENAEEKEFFEKSEGKLFDLLNSIGKTDKKSSNHPVDLIKSIVPTDTKLLLIHNVCLKETDIRLLKEHFNNLFFVLCPGSNDYISSIFPDIQSMLRHSCCVALGTDSYASNTQLSILSEMKMLQNNFPDLSFSQILEMATLNGAKALDIAHKYGSFEKGKTPGINLIEGMDVRALKMKENTRIKVLV